MKTRTFISKIASVAQHSIGVGVIFTATISLHGSEAAGDAAARAWEYGFLLEQKWEYLLQLGLSACIWALVVIAFKFALLAHRDLKNAKLEPKRVALKPRGTVMTETLIVFPVFLLLTLGLLQLTLNNTAAIFTSLAAFQSGRTVHLWAPEIGSLGRNGGVSSDDVNERARIAAASVLAPVAPSGYSDGGCNTSPLFNNKLEAMMSVTLGAAGSLGNATVGAVKALALGKGLATQDRLKVAKAYDFDNFAVRAPVKLLIAYCQTQASFSNSGGNHRVEVRFNHKQTMPLVGAIFGQQLQPTGRYSQVTRTYVIPEQINPNPSHPRSFFSLLNFNPFSGIM